METRVENRCAMCGVKIVQLPSHGWSSVHYAEALCSVAPDSIHDVIVREGEPLEDPGTPALDYLPEPTGNAALGVAVALPASLVLWGALVAIFTCLFA